MRAADEDEVNKRTTDRLFGLSDGVFAIAMTLLALDLRVPDLGDHPSDHALRRGLLDQEPRYLAFLISFYVIAGYWIRHNAEMRTVHAGHPALLRRTISLLLVVCALPFAADLLGTYGGQDGIAILVYAGLNVLALGSLLLIRYEARHHRLNSHPETASDSLNLWFDLVALVLAAPSGYLVHGHGVVVMIGWMVLGGTTGRIVTYRRARRAAATPPATDALSAE